MARLADAEKHNGNKHWTIYDGKGGVFRAERSTNGHWRAVPVNGAMFYYGKTLRELRQRIAEAA